MGKNYAIFTFIHPIDSFMQWETPFIRKALRAEG